MKYILFLVSSLIIQAQESHLIPWHKDVQLVWSDFQGIVPEGIGGRKAVCASKIIIDPDFYIGDTPKYIISCYFDKQVSWSITDKYEFLEHERLHFDITEWYARKIRKQLDSLVKKGEKDISHYEIIFNQLLEKCEKAQYNFDNETYSSRTNHKLWVAKVAQGLEDLKAYEFVQDSL